MHENGQAVVIPVIIQPCLWSISKLAKNGKLQVLPKDGKPITDYENQHNGWLNVAEGIYEVAQKKLSLKQLAKKVPLEESQDKKENKFDLVKRFLDEYSQWYFSPLRIVKWGGRQPGFSSLSRYQSKEVGEILKEFEKRGQLKKKISQKCNFIYKLK